jgi:hypothetical protein
MSLRVQILFIAVVAGRTVIGARDIDLEPHGQDRDRIHSSLGESDLGSLHALQVFQVWVRFMLCRQIRFGFALCLARRSGRSVGGHTVQSVAGPLISSSPGSLGAGVCFHLASGLGLFWAFMTSQALAGTHGSGFNLYLAGRP